MWSGLSVHGCQVLWIHIKSHLVTDSKMTQETDHQNEMQPPKDCGKATGAVRRKPITSIERTRKLSILLKHHQRYAVSVFFFF